MRSGRETGNGWSKSQHTRPMGDRPDLAQVCSETGLGSVRRGLGGTLEQHDARRDQDAQDGHYGSERFPSRSSDHEEATSLQVDSIVRGVYYGGAHLHYNRTHEERKLARVFARQRKWQGPQPEVTATDRHGGAYCGRHGLLGVAELHSP
uniref:Uncharacterized protein n=1 Tax=Cacopsylla melanoneura TaxID=428564 RepID=A0A8D8V6H4_9HEMI